jgi:hypothetical protein
LKSDETIQEEDILTKQQRLKVILKEIFCVMIGGTF